MLRGVTEPSIGLSSGKRPLRGTDKLYHCIGKQSDLTPEGVPQCNLWQQGRSVTSKQHSNTRSALPHAFACDVPIWTPSTGTRPGSAAKGNRRLPGF